MKFTEFFGVDNDFHFIDGVREGGAPWSALAEIKKIIAGHLAGPGGAGLGDYSGYLRFDEVAGPDGAVRERTVTIERTFVAPESIHAKEAEVFIGAGTMLETGAIIKGPCVIGENCEVRQGAYLRGNVIVGDECVIGHVTEVKNSIFMNRSNAGHFAYVGDSIIGSNVNLGAGTKLANLRFRTPDQIDAGSFGEVTTVYEGKETSTGLSKLGALIGDYSEIGCNTVTAPGALIGMGCWVYPNTTVPKGLHGPRAILRNAGAGKIEILDNTLK